MSLKQNTLVHLYSAIYEGKQAMHVALKCGGGRIMLWVFFSSHQDICWLEQSTEKPWRKIF